jgi:hypothetical protein
MQQTPQLRVQRAQELRETTEFPIEHVSDHVGFGSSAALPAAVHPAHWCAWPGLLLGMMGIRTDAGSRSHPGLSPSRLRAFGTVGYRPARLLLEMMGGVGMATHKPIKWALFGKVAGPAVAGVAALATGAVVIQRLPRGTAATRRTGRTRDRAGKILLPTYY